MHWEDVTLHGPCDDLDINCEMNESDNEKDDEHEMILQNVRCVHGRLDGLGSRWDDLGLGANANNKFNST
jgi:hypothetical protein